jgi:hypothetical protein
MNLMRGIDLKKIAEKMNGASGAELKVLSHWHHNLVVLTSVCVCAVSSILSNCEFGFLLGGLY